MTARNVPRRITAIALLLVQVIGTGCYSFVPVVHTGIPAGTQVSLRITDAGRIALGGSMGPEIGAVDGRLVQHTATEYTLAVSGVRFLRGGEQRWNGERMSLRNDHVADVREQRLSKTRTGLLAGLAISAVVYAATRGLSGSGERDPGRTPTDTAATTRIPRY